MVGKFLRSLFKKSTVYLLPFGIGITVTALSNLILELFLLSTIFGSIATFIFHYLFAPRYVSFPDQYFRKQQSFLVTLMLFSFLFCIPTNIDRSISVWLLAKTYNKEYVTKNQYLEYAADFFKETSFEVDRRIGEQISIGNLVEKQSETYELTFQGKKSVEVFRLLAQFFSLNKKYSDGS
jgi:hypothetical protein